MMSDQNNRIYEKLDKLDEKFDRKFDKLDTRQDNTEKQLIVYNEQLKTHIAGVQEARKENAMLREYIDLENEKLRKDIAPIAQHVINIQSNVTFWKKLSNYILKAIGIISVISGLVYSIMQIKGLR